MSEYKRNWNPCNICSKYYHYTCEHPTGIKNCKNFNPENSFKNFLALNNFEIKPNCRIDDLDKIYMAEGSIEKIEDSIDLRNKSINEIIDILSIGFDFNFVHTFIIPIDDKTRESIYNDPYIMSHYEINMIIDKDIKKSLKYRLDQRFNYIES